MNQGLLLTDSTKLDAIESANTTDSIKVNRTFRAVIELCLFKLLLLLSQVVQSTESPIDSF